MIPEWGGGAQAAVAYTIYQTSPQRFAGSQAMADVFDEAAVAAFNTSGFIFFVPIGAAAPDPSYGNEGQFAHQPSTGDWWEKLSGVWTAIGSPVVGYGGTSATSLAIGTGAKAFATQANLAYNGARVRAASSAAPATNWMEGVCSYAGTTLTMTSDLVGGAGTHTDWLFSIAGQPGNMMGSNNLSEVTDKPLARINIGAAPASALALNNMPINAGMEVDQEHAGATTTLTATGSLQFKYLLDGVMAGYRGSFIAKRVSSRRTARDACQERAENHGRYRASFARRQ